MAKEKGKDVFADLEKKRTEPRAGGSRTYDQDGNLVAIDGKPVNRPTPERASKPRAARRAHSEDGGE